LVRRVRPDKRVLLRLSRKVEARDLEALGRVVEQRDALAILQISQDRLQAAVGQALARLPLVDLTVEDPPLEEVMRELFAQSATARAEAAEPGASRKAQAQDRAAVEAE
jgi:ABC-2 type transport system ATP-binding protein